MQSSKSHFNINKMVVIYYIYENYEFNFIHLDYWNTLREELNLTAL
jgi:hypothetical protein